MLAKQLKTTLPKADWLASEKYDGVRLAWNGRGSFHTRGGKSIVAPSSFASALPVNVPLNGELFAGRGKFVVAQSLYSTPSDQRWKGAHYRVFDMPRSKAVYRNVYAQLSKTMPMCSSDGSISPHPVCLVRQTKVSTDAEVRKMMAALVRSGGEGVMLRRANRPYRPSRSADILKVKKKEDAEAVVVGYSKGTGRLRDVIGALVCTWPGGRPTKQTFKVGSGMSDRDRQNARRIFPLGTVVTVEFMELTARGLPRHPVLKGIRTDK
jgi:DNA ligase-1